MGRIFLRNPHSQTLSTAPKNGLLRSISFAALLLCLLFFSACSPVTRSEQGGYPDLQPLRYSETIGQTFTARYAGLSGISVYVRVKETGSANLRLHLRSSPTSQEDLLQAEIPLADLPKAGFARFRFPALPDSTGRDFYAFLELTGEGTVQMGSASANSYLHGALYRDHEAQDAQLTFRLIYDSRPMFLGLLSEGLRWLALLLAGAFLFVLPGWALLNALLPGWSTLSWGEKAGLATGASLGFYPLLMLWTGLIGLKLGPVYAWLPPIAGLLWLVWQYLRQRRRMQGDMGLRPRLSSVRALWSRLSWEEIWPSLALAALLALVIVLRMWSVRSIDVPMFGDSYQHTMMAQLIMDNGGLFESWEPYTELYSFTYHFGFHSMVAVFHWVTGLNAPEAVLYVGQILNVLSILALVPLAVRLGKSRWAGAAAVLVAGLLAPMPNMYLNWGRYTQLAGHVILPAAIFIGWLALEHLPATSRRAWKLNGLSWILLGGLALTHYIVLMYAIFFFAAWFLLNLNFSGGLREALNRVLNQVGRLIMVGIGGVLLFLPWFIHIFIGKILVNFGRNLSTPSSQATVWADPIGNLFKYLPVALWLLLPILLAWGLWRRERGIAILGLWWFITFLSANPYWLKLPGTGAISNLTVFVAAYIPAAVLVGAAVGWAVCALPPHERLRGRLTHFLLAILMLGVGVLSAPQRLRDIDPARHAMVLRPDLRAAAWIRENTDPSSRFLVNAFFAYNDDLIAGSDGGWWLPLLTGRLSTLPPLTYGTEVGPIPRYIRWVNELAAQIQEKGIDHPEVLAMLKERGVTHVYIGQQHGSINSSGPLLSVEDLRSSPHYRLVYHQDRVWIFEIEGGP